MRTRRFGKRKLKIYSVKKTEQILDEGKTMWVHLHGMYRTQMEKQKKNAKKGCQKLDKRRIRPLVYIGLGVSLTTCCYFPCHGCKE